MKKIFLMCSVLLMPVISQATVLNPSRRSLKPVSQAVPAALSSFSRTETLEWGCPVADLVEADNPGQALNKIKEECIEQVRKAAALKPGVFDVLKTSVIWPDVRSSREQGGFHLKGTIFLETLVLRDGEEK